MINKKPIGRKNDIVTQEVKDELMIYDLQINRAFCLNLTSRTVWQFCNGKNTISDISKLMSKKLKTLISEDMVWLTLDQLQKENLLENNDELRINFGGLSRREMIRKVGVTSLAVLPLIVAVNAPQAINAASTGICLNDTDPCDDGNICTVGDYCSGGRCIGGFLVSCPNSADPCLEPFCHPSTGCGFRPNGTC